MTKNKSKKLYMITTTDELELPIMVCDSIPEVARKLGKYEPSVYNGFYTKCRAYHVIDVDDEIFED